MQARRLILRSALVAVLILLLLAANTGRNIAGWVPLSESPEARLAELAPAWRLVRPAGPGPHPVAILLPGCDGVHDNMDLWAGLLAAQGRAALILDSHSPRGLDRRQAWRAVCAGQVLTGAERAGDLAVLLAALDRMPGLEADDVLLLGASHGGWAVMEMLALLGEGRDAHPPPGLTRWPEPVERMAARIGGAVLLYPYCGIASRADAGGWPAGAQALMILAGRDQIVDAAACRNMADALAGQGVAMTVKTLEQAGHGFDQRSRSVLSTLAFDAGATARAEALVRAFASPASAGL